MQDLDHMSRHRKKNGAEFKIRATTVARVISTILNNYTIKYKIYYVQRTENVRPQGFERSLNNIIYHTRYDDNYKLNNTTRDIHTLYIYIFLLYILRFFLLCRDM